MKKTHLGSNFLLALTEKQTPKKVITFYLHN